MCRKVFMVTAGSRRVITGPQPSSLQVAGHQRPHTRPAHPPSRRCLPAASPDDLCQSVSICVLQFGKVSWQVARRSLSLFSGVFCLLSEKQTTVNGVELGHHLQDYRHGLSSSRTRPNTSATRSEPTQQQQTRTFSVRS